MINPMDLTGRVIVVTGASGGIGRATSILLSQLGAKVIVVSRNRSHLEETLALLEGSGHCIEPFDLGSTDEIPSWLERVSAKIGQLKGVVHCAGRQLLKPIRISTSGDFEDLMRINFTAAAMIAKGFRKPGVHEPRAGIVFVSSVMGNVGAPGCSAYSASKGALHSLARSLAIELARDGIRVNCVAPAFVKTDMLQNLKSMWSSEESTRIEEKHLLGFGDPRNVSYVIAFLLAETGQWITGSTLIVDGGYTA